MWEREKKCEQVCVSLQYRIVKHNVISHLHILSSHFNVSLDLYVFGFAVK